MEGDERGKEEEPVLGCMMALLILILCVLASFSLRPERLRNGSWRPPAARSRRVIKIKTLRSISFSPGRTRFMCHQRTKFTDKVVSDISPFYCRIGDCTVQ